MDDQFFSQMFDMSIRSGDIRDGTGKLSEIAPKFGPRKFWGADLPKVVYALSYLPRGTSSGKFS